MLELYQAEGCPYSEEVRDRLTELGVSYVAHNPRTPNGEVLNREVFDEMVAIGGEDQIPFLVDHGRGEQRHGSDAIVAYLDDYYA